MAADRSGMPRRTGRAAALVFAPVLSTTFMVAATGPWVAARLHNLSGDFATAWQWQLGALMLMSLLVLRLDPQRDEAWLMVGDIMQANMDVEAARAAYARVKSGSPDFASAQAKLAWSYQAAGDKCLFVEQWGDTYRALSGETLNPDLVELLAAS